MGVLPSGLLDESPEMIHTLVEAHNFRVKEAERKSRGR